MTKQHERYLQRYPERIARERRNRRIHARNAKTYKRTQMSGMRKLLERYTISRGPIQKVRAGNKKNIGDRIKSLFRKPTI